RQTEEFRWPAGLVPLVSMGLVGYELSTPAIASHPAAIFVMLMLLSGMLAVFATREEDGTVLYVLGTLASALIVAAWIGRHFVPEQVFMVGAVVLAFCLLHLMTFEVRRKRAEEPFAYFLPAAAMPLFGMGFIAYLLSFPSIGQRPGIVLTLLLILGGILAYQAVRREEARFFNLLGGLVSFALLAAWTTLYMKASLLSWGLGFYLAFAVLHTLLPIMVQRVRPSAEPFLVGYCAPIAMLVLIMVAMVACDILSFAMWPVVLILGMLAVATAWLAASLVAMFVTVILVMGCFGIWLFRLPPIADPSSILMLLAFFTCAFFAWGLWITSRKSVFPSNAKLSMAGTMDPDDAAELPALTTMMPFLLIALVCVKMQLPNPADVFGFLAFINVLLLGLVRYRAAGGLAMIGMISTTLVEYVWHAHSFNPGNLAQCLPWYLGFYGAYTLFPFVWRRHIKTAGPWMASALVGIMQFYLFYDTMVKTAGKGAIGTLPALLAAPALIALAGITRIIPKQSNDRDTLVALFGGVALFFVTIIIPLQFDKEWITLGWALEGAALIWLFRRVAHHGLKTWGAGLLAIAFVRLALNPAVFMYHPRTATPFLNWYLLVYGLTVVSFYAAAYWVPSGAVGSQIAVEMAPAFKLLGTVLLFLLVNIEIADFFSAGSTITFNFSGNLTQDMTYSLAWGVFAIAVLLAGISGQSKSTRYGSLGLLMATIVKVFLHDLWRLGGLTRVASIIGLAVMLILVSFLYQKFLSAGKQTEVRHA
ncbi:MAG TPA: DUF2339 domain-containing protein, partial [Elusimicrobiota bacterium]|nr:DUF2339 domain-containing protein [Elusimicrobiota bacterium]